MVLPPFYYSKFQWKFPVDFLLNVLIGNSTFFPVYLFWKKPSRSIIPSTATALLQSVEASNLSIKSSMRDLQLLQQLLIGYSPGLGDLTPTVAESSDEGYDTDKMEKCSSFPEGLQLEETLSCQYKNKNSTLITKSVPA